ncbi:hypothetical protein [Baaleninema sp.]|uniref:hypothetical protein n=1 Tax=Baaleninema sp. TaxID=3101197 RepID=UPI003CFEB6EC
MSTPDRTDLARIRYETAKDLFERGQYRDAVTLLDQACALVDRGTPLGGEIQIWLVTAYQAVGDLKAATRLCRKLSRHPHITTRQQSRRLLAILEAPRLAMRPEWNVNIPDLSSLEESTASDRKGSNRPLKRKPRPLPPPKPIDPSEINTQDNRFVWVALLASLAILSSLLWLA